MAINKPNYTPPSARLTFGMDSLKNPYFKNPELLKHGKLKGKTEVKLPGKLGTMYVAPGHNIEKAIERYTRTQRIIGMAKGGKRFDEPL